MAEYYSVDLSEKVVHGMTDNALKCMFNGGTLPIGYIIDKEQHFQIDPVTSPFVLAAAVVREELMERSVEQTDGMPHADYVGVFVGAVLFRRETCGPRVSAAQYARLSALCPQGIRASAPGYVLDRCAVCTHTPGVV